MAATHTHTALLSMPASLLEKPKSPQDVFTFLRQAEESWNTTAIESCQCVISDFWIGKIWTTVSETWLTSDKHKLQSVWNALPYPLVAPHLVVSLQSGLGDPPTGEFIELLDRPRQFPVLKLKEHSPETVLAEIFAAVEAMCD